MRDDIVFEQFSADNNFKCEISRRNNNNYDVWVQEKFTDEYADIKTDYYSDVYINGYNDSMHITDNLKSAIEIGNQKLKLFSENKFNQEVTSFFASLDRQNTMVLSTSCNNIVSSRMMSIVIIDNIFYFQTDCTFKKYNQIIKNPNVALCTDNIQIEGICTEAGKPINNKLFCNVYKSCFPNSYTLYSKIENERLFYIQPKLIQKWIYINEKPFIETYDFENKIYMKREYII